MGFGDGVMMPSINAIEMDLFLDTWEEKNVALNIFQYGYLVTI